MKNVGIRSKINLSKATREGKLKHPSCQKFEKVVYYGTPASLFCRILLPQECTCHAYQRENEITVSTCSPISDVAHHENPQSPKMTNLINRAPFHDTKETHDNKE